MEGQIGDAGTIIFITLKSFFVHSANMPNKAPFHRLKEFFSYEADFS